MNCQSDGVPRRCFRLHLAVSHMEDTWSYITAFIGHNERAVRGLCQFSSFAHCLFPFFFFFCPSLSVSTVMTWSCLLILLQDSLNGLIRKRENNRPAILVVCLRLCLWLDSCFPASQTWLGWTVVGELPADKKTWLTGTSARLMASPLWEWNRQTSRERWEKLGDGAG